MASTWNDPGARAGASGVGIFAERRGAPDSTATSSPPPVARITSWRAYRNAAGTMLGFLSVELPSGMVVHGLKLMLGPAGKHWIAPPATKREAADGGKATWDPIVEFADRQARERFNAVVLEALRAAHPEAFEQP